MMEKSDAINFFSELFKGEHHIPSDVKPCDGGWSVTADPRIGFSTFDYDYLTRLVLLSHDRCVRSFVEGSFGRRIKITIWQRYCREGSMSKRHPTIDQALCEWRKSHISNEDIARERGE